MATVRGPRRSVGGVLAINIPSPSSSHGPRLDRREGRETLGGPGVLAGPVAGGEFAADVGTGVIDRASLLRIKEAACLVEGQRMQLVGPLRRLEPAAELQRLGDDSRLAGRVPSRGEDCVVG